MKKIIREISNQFISEKLKEWLSVEQTLDYFKSLKPINNIEKRVIQRSVCILWWYLMHQKWEIDNYKIVTLIKYLS